MNHRLWVVAACAALTACQPAPEPAPTPTPTPTPTPVPTVTPITLYPRPSCVGAMSTGVKLVCDTDALDNLDRILHRRWAAARANATPQLILDLDTVQTHFLAERDACLDVKCVTNVYRAYLDPRYRPAPAPGGTPTPAPKPTPRPRPRPHPLPQPEENPSCAARIGMPAAQELSRQCRQVNPGWQGECSVERSCGTLRKNVQGGCDMQFHKPDFCRR